MNNLTTHSLHVRIEHFLAYSTLLKERAHYELGHKSRFRRCFLHCKPWESGDAKGKEYAPEERAYADRTAAVIPWMSAVAAAKRSCVGATNECRHERVRTVTAHRNKDNQDHPLSFSLLECDGMGGSQGGE